MTYSTQMILAQLRAEAAEAENKRKRQEAIKDAISVARALADKGTPVLYEILRRCLRGAFGANLSGAQ